MMLALGIGTAQAVPVSPWPGEPLSQAVNLTSVEGPGTNDFYVNLSGAYWNETKQELWVVRNGGTGGSKVWVLQEYTSNGQTAWRVKTKNGVRGEWSNFGDLEDITFANDASDIVYLMIEDSGHIQAYDMSRYDQRTLVGNYNISNYIPPYSTDSNDPNKGKGPEGIAFVPNETLQAVGFKDNNDALRLGTPIVNGGLGGLIFVGHQNGAPPYNNSNIYVFDLTPNSTNFTYVGKYKTSYAETAALNFDRSTGELYIWHDDIDNKLEVSDLRTTRNSDGSYSLNIKRVFEQPGTGDPNLEGVAVRPVNMCGTTGRQFFITIDDGGANSLLQFRQFTDGCGVRTCSASNPCPGGQLCDQGTCYTCPLDINGLGMIDAADMDLFNVCFGNCYQAGTDCRNKNFDGSANGCITILDRARLTNAMGPTSAASAACLAARTALQNQYNNAGGGKTDLSNNGAGGGPISGSPIGGGTGRLPGR